MRVSSLKLKDFRGFATCELSLDRPLTVLVGGNGAGKTSVLEAIACLLNVTNARSSVTQKLAVDADIRRGAPACHIQMAGVTNGVPFETMVHLARGGEPTWSTSAPEGTRAPSPWSHVDGEPFEPPGSPTPVPLAAAYYPVDRVAPDRRYAVELFSPMLESDLEKLESLARLQVRANVDFKDFFTWFRFREDFENEQRSRGTPTYEDRALTAVRDAIARVVPGISRLRVQRIPYRLVATKNGAEYALDQLSDGERGLLAMVGDLAYRLTIANREIPDPLQSEALVLIDEIEQHLHPGWQRLVVRALRSAFPNCQFIITTHSPQVLSEVPNDAVTLVQDFQFFRPAAPMTGRDTNSILWEVLGVSAHPREIVQEIEAISGLLDGRRDREARERLDRLAETLTERDPDVSRLRDLLDIVERIDASDHQGA
jgi:predicted ATP-binding protein involved in virulence